MSIKQKILLRVGFMMVLATLVIIFIVSFNFRNYGIDAAKDKAQIIAELVKTGLTSHMINGTMDHRDVFLDGISTMKDVESLWVVRGEMVNKQYGPPRPDELPRDDIDKLVLENGKIYETLDEGSERAVLRFTIPYNATTNETAKCLECHDAKFGDTLGAISMEFDIMSIRNEGVKTILNILLTTLVAIAIVIILTNRSINPYLELFEQLKNSLRQATLGDFSRKIHSDLKDEAGDMVDCYDSFLGKLDKVFGQIDQKLRIFVAESHQNDQKDPLAEATDIITELTNIYQFKKAIELDVEKEDIYKRLAYLIKHNFGINNFTFTEVDANNQISVVLQEGTKHFCDKAIYQDGDLCRAKRTGKNAISEDFPKLCPSFEGDDAYKYACVPVHVGGNIGLIINMVAETDEQIETVKNKLAFIKNFANEAAPVIESKKLMQMLKESSLKDGLTGLYNRRFMDQYVEKLAPQVIRQKTSVGILMVDMDHFKMINDNYGHDIGDLVLKELSSVLGVNVRDADLVVRYGGEEFVVLLMNVETEETVMAIAEKLRSRVAEKKISIGSGKTLQKTISIGVSIFTADSESIWQCIKFADVALYEAKNSGRNRVVRFTPELWKDQSF